MWGITIEKEISFSVTGKHEINNNEIIFHNESLHDEKKRPILELPKTGWSSIVATADAAAVLISVTASPSTIFKGCWMWKKISLFTITNDKKVLEVLNCYLWSVHLNRIKI